MLAEALRVVRGSALTRKLVAALAAGYISLCRRTCRWEILGSETRDLLRSGRGRFVLAIWHGRLLMVPTEMSGDTRVRAIVSRNNDGELITKVVGRFGIRTIRGSTRDRRKPDLDKGGREAFRAGLQALREEEDVIVALTPDGPRGPLMRCQHGVATLSVMSGASVVPWTFSVRHGRFLGSWDRFLLVRPFSRGVVAYGTPLSPPAERTAEAIETYRLEIEAAITALTRAADARVGRATPEPGPWPK
ncbi:lysophospholipid acyltransferase family protein [Oceanicella sp. SM1341]|uniref:lysophospholipid acyltransferase family protein n=1 Tax=Oceanicella sp. SM1341 TaxID=1548889 RepID=UPI000E4C6267|nr:lysophospholipid acyltransferase family protein [Oceanicella sp. SM1341]